MITNNPVANGLTYTMLMGALRKVRRVQLYKNNACVLLLHILSIVNSDWLQHAGSIQGVYEYDFISKYAKVARVHYFCTIALRTSRAVLMRA